MWSGRGACDVAIDVFEGHTHHKDAHHEPAKDHRKGVSPGEESQEGVEHWRYSPLGRSRQ